MEIKIDNIFNEYSNKVSELYVYQQTIRRTTEHTLQEMLGVRNREGHNFFFHDIRTNEIHFYAQLERSNEEIEKSIKIQKNRQYCWLLVEAFEGFEQFLDKVYAQIGFNDFKAWPLHDFGNVFLSEVMSQPYQWFLNCVKKKKNRPDSILRELRRKYSKLSDIETSNAFSMNMKLVISIVEHLRHVIVHKSGVIVDKEVFLNDLMKRYGYHGSNIYYECCSILEMFTVNVNNNYQIVLTEVRWGCDPCAYTDRLALLLDCLLSYAKYISDLLMS